MNLSNARIIEWGEGDDTFVGARTSPRNGFRTVSANAGGAANHVGFITELVAEQFGARVVAEFPTPSLAEIVGGAPLDAYEAHVLAREAHEAAEEQQRQLDAAALTDVYALIRAAAGRGEMHLLWTPARCANFPRRREFVTRALRRAGYGVATASDGARIEWTAAPPEAAEASEVVS